MSGSRRIAVFAAVIALLIASIALASGVGRGGTSGEGEAGGAGTSADSSEQGGSSTSDGSGDADDPTGNGGDDGATETRNDPPPTQDAADGQQASGKKKTPGIGPNGELVPVETAAGPGETLGQESGQKSGKKAGQKAGQKAGTPAPAVDTGPLVSRPLPKTVSSRGRLVRGFPSKALPLVPGSKVLSSSVSSSPRGLQVALVGSAPRRTDAVAAWYRLALARYGFAESAVPAVGGSSAFGFSRAKDSLVLTVTREGKRSTYSLYGTLSTGSD